MVEKTDTGDNYSRFDVMSDLGYIVFLTKVVFYILFSGKCGHLHQRTRLETMKNQCVKNSEMGRAYLTKENLNSRNTVV